MAKENKENEQTGIVTESLPNAMFRIKLDENNQEILAYLSGKMRMHRIRVLIGDKVSLVVDQYGGKARISRRL